MMLLNDVADSFSQTIFTSHLHPILHMGNEDEARHRWSEMVVFIFSPSDVLNEVERFFQLPNVMIISTDPCQQGVGRNGFGSTLHQTSDDDAVVIRSRSLKDQVLKE